MMPAPAEYEDRCRAAVEAVGLPFIAALVPPSQGVLDYERLVREFMKVTAPKAPTAAAAVEAPAPPPTATPAIVIPDQLRRDDLRFIKVRAGGKDALEKAWPTVANYSHNDPAIALHTANGGNFGVFPASGSRLLIIDADDLARLAEIDALEGAPETFTIASGSSSLETPKRHFYFEIEGGPLEGKRPFYDPATAGPAGHLGDLFAQGATGRGYVVGPGSIHPCGEPYTVLSDLPIATLPREVWEHFERTVRWLSARTPAPTERAQARTAARGGTIGDLVGLTVTDIWPIPSTAERTGDNYLFPHPVHGSTKGEKGKNISVNPVLNKWKCFRCDSGGDALMALAVEERIIDCNEAHPGALDDPGRMKAVEEALRRRNYDVDEADRQRRATAPKRGRPPKAASSTAAGPTRPSPAPPAAEALPEDLARFVYRGPRGALRVDDAAVADHLYERHATVSFNDKIYVYQDGIYGPDKGTVSAEVKRFIRECGTHEQLTRVLREVIAHLLATNPFTTQPFNLATNLIPVANGVISIDYETGRAELLPHSPGYRFTFKLPVVYDPAATPADALALLSQYVAPEDVPLLVQPFAQALLQTQLNKTYKKNYLIQGNRDAAKSTYTLILEGFFGPENISHVSLQALTTDRFCKGRMENKLINYFDDLDAVPLSQIGLFKALTGSTTHDIERKFESGYAGRIVCPHIFTCNRPPRVADDAKTDDAWWGRWEYVRFPYSFPIDPTFPDRTLTPAFYSSLLAAVLAMMIEIRQRGSLTINRTPAEVQQRWNVMSDPLFQFIDAKMERLAATVNDFDKGKLFRAYLTWCEDTGLPMGLRIQTPTAFTQALEPYGIQPIHTSKKINGRKRDYEIYRGGYRWKNEKEDMGYDFGPFTGGAN